MHIPHLDSASLPYYYKKNSDRGNIMLGVSSLIRKSHLALPAMSAYHFLQLVFL